MTRRFLISLLFLMGMLHIWSLIPTAGAREIKSTPGREDMIPILVRAQYSASIGGHNEAIAGVIIEYRRLGSTVPLIAETNEDGICYIVLKSGTRYEINISYRNQTKKFILEYGNQTTLLISIDLSKGEIVDCTFLKAETSPKVDRDPKIITIFGFTLYLSHMIFFIIGLSSSLIIYIIGGKDIEK